MQNKNTQKIIIDKVKLKTLQRLNCPEEVIIQKIIHNNFIPQGDELIDLLLESLTDEKTFSNWGGSRENAGRKSSKNNNINQDEKIKMNESNCNNQLVDKDKDIDIDNNKEIYNIYFEEFWNLYTPIKCDGRFVAKGDKKSSLAKFIKILQKGEEYENIIRGTKQYIDYCRENNQLTCGVPVFLNQERWKNDYSGSTCQSSERGKRQEPHSIVETYAEIAAEYEKKNNIR